MFGTNEVTKPFPDEMGRLLVNDVFYTIQGEGPDQGRPAVFVRLAKCNLRCYFCDTEFEKGSSKSKYDVSRTIAQMTLDNKCRLVVITGGEPFLQNIRPLIDLLNKNGIEVSVETAGTVFPTDHEEMFMRRMNKIICSPKTPQVNATLGHCVVAWKYIVRVGDVSEDDGLPNMSTQIMDQPAKISRPRNNAPIYIQPMDEQDPARNKANAELAAQVCMRFGYRLTLQMHKQVGLP